jgi:hypothetical protein
MSANRSTSIEGPAENSPGAVEKDRGVGRSITDDDLLASPLRTRNSEIAINQDHLGPDRLGQDFPDMSQAEGESPLVWRGALLFGEESYDSHVARAW